jgi:methionyl aminopeptidase
MLQSSSLKRLILDPQQCESMRSAGRFNAELMDFVRPHVQPGITTGEIDRLVHDYTLDHGHVPACLGYRGFPRSCCTSINEVICHGIPGDDILAEGDIVNLDLTSIVDGWFGDQSETFLLGDVSLEARQVSQCALDGLYLAIEAIEPNGRIGQIGNAIKQEADSYGFSVVREYVGHGLGGKFHQDPSIPHCPGVFPDQDRVKIPVGICFTIEPMINVGTYRSTLDRTDNWTVRTADGKLSAQFEHTILMTEKGSEILTLTSDGPQVGHKFVT